MTAHGLVRQRESLILEISHEGISGFGEAAPLASYDGGDIEMCDAALRDCLEMIGSLDPSDPDAIVNSIGESMPVQARAALDTAARDLAARISGQPLYRALGAQLNEPIEVSALLTHSDPLDASHEAARFVARGFSTVKLKVGLDQDARLVRMVREAVGEDVGLRLDANGAWEPSEAAQRLGELAKWDPQLCEQPCRGVDQMRNLRAISPVLTALDEDATEPLALTMPPTADAVCLKLQACGGLDRMLDAATRARACGMKVYLGSTLEGPVSVGASLHAAVAIGPDLASGLATLETAEGMGDVFPVIDGMIELSDHLGIGVGPDGSQW